MIATVARNLDPAQGLESLRLLKCADLGASFLWRPDRPPRIARRHRSIHNASLDPHVLGSARVHWVCVPLWPETPSWGFGWCTVRESTLLEALNLLKWPWRNLSRCWATGLRTLSTSGTGHRNQAHSRGWGPRPLSTSGWGARRVTHWRHFLSLVQISSSVSGGAHALARALLAMCENRPVLAHNPSTAELV